MKFRVDSEYSDRFEGVLWVMPSDICVVYFNKRFELCENDRTCIYPIGGDYVLHNK